MLTVMLPCPVYFPSGKLSVNVAFPHLWSYSLVFTLQNI